MKPDFALNLSHEGLSLLHRVSDGWRVVGEVALDDPEMAQKLGFLRKTAGEMAKGRLASKLVIPNSQILYQQLSADSFDGPVNEGAIRSALDGTTPYPIDDLAFDWIKNLDGTVHVAAVARLTLNEAEEFATEHRFNPVSIVAIPDEADFASEPYFGATKLSKKILARKEQVEPDHTIITIVGDIDRSAPEPAARNEDTTDDAFKVPAMPPADEPTGEPPQSGEQSITFTTQRTGGDGDALIEPSTDRPPARFALYADKQDSAEAVPTDMDPDGDPSEAPDIENSGVTSPALPADLKRKKPGKKQVPKRKYPQKIAPPPIKKPDDNTAPATPFSVPPAPEFSQPSETVQEPEQQAKSSALDGESLTVFGARRDIGKEPAIQPLALFLGLGLTVALALVGLVWFLLTLDDVAGDVANDLPPAVPSPETQTSVLGNVDNTGVAPEISNDTLIPPAGNDLSPSTGVTTALVRPQTDTPDLDTTSPAPALAPDPAPTESLPTLNDAELAESDVIAETAEDVHDATGIWQLSPVPPVDLDTGRADDIYIASIDRKIISNDAVALPAGRGALRDDPLPEMLPPPALGTTFDLDANGRVKPRPEGALNPDGIQIFLGSPSTVPDLRPGTTQPTTDSTVIPEITPGTRPLARPENIVETDEKARLGGRTRTQLAAIRPTLRPASPQDLNTQENTDAAPSDLAVLTSRAPASRPDGFSAKVEQAVAAAVASAAASTANAQANAIAAPSSPSIPTRASVARAATTENAINLSRVNLIGVYGSSSDRRALVRLKSGRYVKVQVGDRLDGGQVAAIDTNRLQYTKRGQTVTLEIAS